LCVHLPKTSHAASTFASKDENKGERELKEEKNKDNQPEEREKEHVILYKNGF
jgi:hypothetical protein